MCLGPVRQSLPARPASPLRRPSLAKHLLQVQHPKPLRAKTWRLRAQPVGLALAKLSPCLVPTHA